MSTGAPDHVEVSSRAFLAGCALVALALFAVGLVAPLPTWLLGAEVFATIIGLFVFGSIRYRIDKNALTYGMLLVIGATFWGVWWPGSAMRAEVAAHGWAPFWRELGHHVLTLEGLDGIVHADTMLFILGLTFFVSVVAQTRLLESVSLAILSRNRGAVMPTIAGITAIVSVASGILDGVSMIGLTIRILVAILFLAHVDRETMIYAVVISTVVTTVCGMWLAYGEPPNLIMKSNLQPHLDDHFFLTYCAPLAVVSWCVVAVSLRSRLRGKHIDMAALDVVQRNAADVRFLQATHHGEVKIAIEYVEDHPSLLGESHERVADRVRAGEPLGRALVEEAVPEPVRRRILNEYLTEEHAGALDLHYVLEARGDLVGADLADNPFERSLAEVRTKRVRAQKIAGLAFVPFVALLVAHAIDHEFRLFYSSFAGFLVALAGIFAVPKMRSLALREARHEFAEYYFLFPLFLSITLLQTAGFFDQIKTLLQWSIQTMGQAHVAFAQFAFCTFLSALLDNNVVADFAARPLRDLPESLMHLFAMAQIAGYALGGCWTHVGSAQSVVAYAFTTRTIDERFTPFDWIRLMTPTLAALFLVLTLMVYLRA
jgi:Na+/H+ antiporter NhaD/arsenite permease-like protein